MPESSKYHHSTHREAILAFVRDRAAHLSAEEIYAAMRPRFPRLSMGTVYRNLHILVAQQRLRVLHFGHGGDRYDARTDPHYHLVCRQCGDMFDIDLRLDDIETAARVRARDFTIESHSVEFHGLCATCRTYACNS